MKRSINALFTHPLMGAMIVMACVLVVAAVLGTAALAQQGPPVDQNEHRLSDIDANRGLYSEKSDFEETPESGDAPSDGSRGKNIPPADLLVKDCLLDYGDEPSSDYCFNGENWLSPDIWITRRAVWPGSPPGYVLVDNLLLDKDNWVNCRVTNMGGSNATFISVEFFWADFGNHPTPTWRTDDFPDGNYRQFPTWKVLEPGESVNARVRWIPTQHPGVSSHRCIYARANCLEDITVALKTNWENNIGWKNFRVEPPPPPPPPSEWRSARREFKVSNPDIAEAHDIILNLRLEDWPPLWQPTLTSPDDLVQLSDLQYAFYGMAPLQVNEVTLVVTEPPGTECDTGTVHIGVEEIGGDPLGGVSVMVVVPICPIIQIEKEHDVIQGQHTLVSITTEGTIHEMGGFDFLVGYDASALALMEAMPGQLLEDCGWEYFTYRYGPFGNCGNACPSGMLRIFALAETNNGPNHPDCFGPPDCDEYEIVKLDFLVTNDRTFECQYVPIRFFWNDCGDNTYSSVLGDTLYISDRVYEFEGTDITDPTYGFPTYFGAQEECLEGGDPDKPEPIRCPVFVNGGVDIICADSIDDRGDINLNGTANEIADAVLFSNYFVHGISVFNVNIDGQIAASDVNADGITLSVADLVYQIRIITGDALPYPKLSPVTADADLVDGVLSVDADMGAAYVVVENSVTPLLLAESMELKYQYDENNNLTRILVYSMEPDRRFSGDFLGGIDGNVMTLEMATYEGAPVTTKLVPDAFALYPCYPNPFNPITTISFALAAPVDYELVIYNSLGQTVETFSGRSGPGLERIDWDASALASGVYFYRLTAGDFSDTKKMVLLK